MQTDFLLASLHHMLFFGLIAMLAMQSALLSAPLDATAVRRLVGIDRGYGATAGLLLLAGALRIAYGVKGSGFYLHNPWFHAKLGAFALAALLSVWPTLAFMRWRRQAAGDPGWRADAGQARGCDGWCAWSWR
jgi:putative membrane protein